MSGQQAPARRIRLALWLAAAGAVLLTSGCAVWRIKQSVALARQSAPWSQNPADASLQLLIVGDSTAVGTGATTPQNSLAGLIGQAHPRWTIHNRARDGARFADVAQQLGGDIHFDLVLVQAGGNDVIRLGSTEATRRDIDRVADLARLRGKRVVWMPAGNLGNAPLFFPPLSWWMTQRSRSTHAAVRSAAQRTGAVYVNLFHARSSDPFVSDPALTARDGLHPSDAGYRLWWQLLSAQWQAPT